MDNLISCFDAFIGRSYSPVLSSVYDAEGVYIGDVVASGCAGVDWSWLASAALLILSIYCIFRIIGGLCRV